MGVATTGVIAAVLAVLWILVAAALSFLAARRFRLAEAVLGSARSTAALLDAAPARPLLVRGDGTIEIDRRLERDLGLSGPSGRLADLAGETNGILRDDLERLAAAIDAARLSAGPDRTQGPGQRLGPRVRGSRRPSSGAGTSGHHAVVALRYQRR